jgi:AbrB family looped-hinge helix DNA binding protein
MRSEATTITTLDSTGRVVVPAEVSKKLGLATGARFSVDVVADRIELTLEAPAESAVVRRSGCLVLAASGEPLDAAAAIRSERQAQAAGARCRWRAAELGLMRLLDSSVVLASLHEAESHYEACSALLLQSGHTLFVHALAELFSTLTGGAQGLRVGADLAQRLLRESVLPYVKTVTLAERDVMAALAQAQSSGVRGGAVYDFLHLVAARKSGAEAVVTLDKKHFAALGRAGDPRIEGV